jgi:hypothetical protein
MEAQAGRFQRRLHAIIRPHPVSLLHFRIFLLDLLHGLGLQLLRTLVQPDKEPPRQQERCRHQADGRRIREVGRYLMTEPKGGD